MRSILRRLLFGPSVAYIVYFVYFVKRPRAILTRQEAVSGRL